MGPSRAGREVVSAVTYRARDEFPRRVRAECFRRVRLDGLLTPASSLRTAPFRGNRRGGRVTADGPVDI
ncbi:hypothetical protein ADK57_46360 [Streptomyces sp. MMG1533]|nr:hypothetical protein ADK57_46360 [Streptomyces sp. MMG1533]